MKPAKKMTLKQARRAFGDNLLEHRRLADISQEELARICDLHRTEVSLLERGERSPRLDTAIVLAEGLELDSPAPLFEGIK